MGSSSSKRHPRSMEFVDPDWTGRYLEHVEGLIYDLSINAELREDMARRDLGARLREITAPVLLVHGRFDSVLAPSTSWSIHQGLPNSRFVVIEESGHMPFVERAAEFEAAVSGFLRGVDRDSQSAAGD